MKNKQYNDEIEIIVGIGIFAILLSVISIMFSR